MTPEVPISTGINEVVFRNLTLPSDVVVAVPTVPSSIAVTGDGAKPTAVEVAARPIRVGRAVVEGRVVGPDRVGIAGAQVAVAGTAQNTVTGGDGTFTIQSLPSGTSEVIARKIGFGRRPRLWTSPCASHAR